MRRWKPAVLWRLCVANTGVSAWVAGIKVQFDYLIQLRNSMCEQLHYVYISTLVNLYKLFPIENVLYEIQ